MVWLLERGILELLILHSGTYNHSDISYFSYRWRTLHLQMQHLSHDTADDRSQMQYYRSTYIHPYVSVVCISVLYGVCVPAVAGV